jgi:hypothetical protein
MDDQMTINKTFAEYATSTAFSISLTKHQCHALLSLAKNPRTDVWGSVVRMPHSVHTYQRLEAR